MCSLLRQMGGFLEEILKVKKEEVERRKGLFPTGMLLEMAGEAEPVRDFASAISKPGFLSLVAEIKALSPSSGRISYFEDPIPIATEYELGGADAVSVLTDERFFGGKLEYLRAVRNSISLPVLRKDFIIDGYQVLEARAFGADSILLIARVLEKGRIEELMGLARELGMEPVVEVHSEEDLWKADGARIIGINNRDLDTFEISLDVTFGLRGLIPEGVVVVSESGIRSARETRALRDIGVDAVLVGEALMKSKDIRGKIKELKGCGGDL